MYSRLLSIVAAILLTLSSLAFAQTQLARRGYLGADLRFNEERRAGEVTNVAPASAAEKVGLSKGSLLVSVDGRAIDSPEAVDALDRLPAGKPLPIRFSNGQSTTELTITLPELPRETHPGLDVVYGSASSGGQQVRTIVTRPTGGEAKLPGIFLVGWLSCDTVESPFEPRDGFAKLIRRIVTESGFLMMRMEKPGVGDSQGDCAKLDFNTELAAYRSAFAAFVREPRLDRERIFLLGMSNGGGVAPLVAETTPVRGYISAGGWGRTWYEHMLEHERARLQLSGKSPAEVSDASRQFALFYTDYLIMRKTPQEVLAAHPEIKPLWYDAPDGQYGRPAAFYQQLNALNLAKAWSGVKVPVLVVRGQHDFIMSQADAKAIADAVNFSNAGAARFVDRQRMNHGFMLHNSPEEAFRGGTPGKFDDGVADLMLDFLREHSR